MTDDDLIPIGDLDALSRSYLTPQELGAGSVRRSVLHRRQQGAEAVALTELRSAHDPLLMRQSVNRGGRRMQTTSAVPVDLGDTP